MNRMTLKQKLLGTVVVFAALSATQANAQSSSNLTVTASVPSACIINAAGTDTVLAFNLAGLTSAVADFTASADFAWQCSLGTAMTISISPGGSTDQLNRAMTGPAGSLAYNLHTDATYATIWGDGTAPTSTVDPTGLGINVVGLSQIFGRILLADAQAAGAGNYNDIVVVTLLP